MTHIRCLGILNRVGTVALRIEIGVSDGVEIGARLNVYDVANEELWGIVEVVETDDSTCYGQPYDRTNPDFWEHLEDRMRYDTSPPEVYLVRELPAGLLEMVELLLDQWR